MSRNRRDQLVLDLYVRLAIAALALALAFGYLLEFLFT